MSTTHTIAGYPFHPRALRASGSPAGQADRFHVLLKEGRLAEVREAIADRPELLAGLLPIVANPEASINVRIGASVVFEEQAGGPALRALLPQIGRLAAHEDARVRADACFYLGLSADDAARIPLRSCLDDPSGEVREIAADAMAALDAVRTPE
ncbi:MAG: HEAT repeat domain-containing protein [Ignavibacteria bacterium]